MNQYWNEENIKNKVVIPYLEDLGFTKLDLSFEDSFTVTIGKNIFRTLNKGNRTKVTVRSDILVKYNKKNFFILEIKKEDHTIDSQDIDQAISYAKLLDEIAPFVVVTNGHVTRVVDTITKKDVKKSNYGDNLTTYFNSKINLDFSKKFEALKRLIDLDNEVLSEFCNQQVEQMMNNLQLNTNIRNSKFIENIYVEREDARNKLNQYLKNNSKFLMVTGISGVGKTNFICNSIYSLIKDKKFVLFFYAAQMSKGLGETIADIFNWEFNHQKSTIQYLVEVCDILNKTKDNLIIFVDAIDEWVLPNANVQLNELLNYLGSKNIKIVLSCKITQLEKFLNIKGYTHMYSELIKNEDKRELDIQKNPNIILLNTFNQSEFQLALQKYSRFFNKFININYSKSSRLLRNPAILRIFFQTSKTDVLNLEDFKFFELYTNYLKELIKQEGNEFLIYRCLEALGNSIIENKNDNIYYSNIDPIYEKQVQILINYNVLTKSEDDNSQIILIFTFDEVRNFVVCYHTLKLHFLSAAEFREIVRNNITYSLLLETFKWFRKDTDDEIKRKISMDEILKQYNILGKRLIEEYQKITSENYPFLYNKNNKLILLYYKDTLDIQSYSFNESFEELIEDKVAIEGIDYNYDHIFGMHHIHTISTSSKILFTGISIPDFVNEIIQRKIDERIRIKNLDESESIFLMSEKIIGHLRLLYQRKIIDFDIFESLPISLSDLSQRIDSANNLQETSSALDKGFFHLIELLINDLSKKTSLLQLVLPLGSKTYEIKEEIGRLPDSIYAAFFYSKDDILRYVSKFFENFLNEYFIMIENNFPTLKEEFKIFKELPCLLIVEIKEITFAFEKTYDIEYTIVKSNSPHNILEIKFENSEFPVFLPNMQVNTNNGIRKVQWIDSFVIHLLFERSDDYNVEMPLTNYLYKILKEEYDGISK